MGFLYLLFLPRSMLPVPHDHPAVAVFRAISREPLVRNYLGRLFLHHHDTYQHSSRVGILSVYLGFVNRVPENHLRLLAYAGALHDVGKLHLPTVLLDKSGALTEEDLAQLRRHPRLSFFELQLFDPEIVRRIVVAHHEYQLDGYPRQNFLAIDHPAPVEDRSRDQHVQLLAQMVSAADMFDGLRNKRAYKPVYALAETEEIMRRQFTGDPRFIDQLVRSSFN